MMSNFLYVRFHTHHIHVDLIGVKYHGMRLSVLGDAGE